MDARTALIALGFAALASGVVWLGFDGQRRYDQAQSERADLAAALPSGPSAEPESSLRLWPEGELTRQDRRAIVLLCVATAWIAWLWLLLAAFGESLAWGFVVLLGHWAGALVFCLFGSRQRMTPFIVMTSAYGLLLGLGVYWTRAAH